MFKSPSHPLANPIIITLLLVPGLLDKKEREKDTIFCIIKDAILFPLLLSNEPGTGIEARVCLSTNNYPPVSMQQ
jgi:hypothetical protein